METPRLQPYKIERIGQVKETERLNSILDGMTVPEMRKQDLSWLRRNLAINNGGHPDFHEAMRLVRFIAKVQKRLESKGMDT